MKTLRPGNDSSHTVARTADSYRKQGQFDKAIMLCLQELQARPTYSSARVVLGRAYLDRGDYAKAEEEFLRVVESSPGNLRARVHLGQICDAQGRTDEAIRHYEAALELSPLDREIQASLVKMRRSVSPSDPSLSSGDRRDILGLPIDLPTSDSAGTEGDLFATETLADLYASQGLTDRAANIYRQLLDDEPSREGVRAKFVALQGRQGIAEGLQPERADATAGGAAVSAHPLLITADQVLLEELERWLQGIRRYREMVAASQ